MLLYAGLGVLVWTTMDDFSIAVGDRKVDVRLLPGVILASLALRTALHRSPEESVEGTERE
jgi:hypothetical protein